MLAGGARAGAVWPYVAGCLAVAALSLLLPSTPTYDPWAWIVWGREILQLDLNTVEGPSWKPLPVLFTVPFSLFGAAAPDLWLLVGRAGALLGLVMAFRLARRLARADDPWGLSVGAALGVVAGLIAASSLALSAGWIRNAALGNSEGLLVALVLWGIERHLDGARRQAFALGFAAALLRPEVWPFLGLYAVWLWLREPGARVLAAGSLALLPVLWLGPELWGSGDALRASSRASQPLAGSPAFADQPALEIVRLFTMSVLPAVKAGALLALALAAYRFVRFRAQAATLALGLGGTAWLALVAAMTEAGYAGNPRYLAVSTAACCVLGGVGLAWLAAGLGPAAGLLFAPAWVRRVAAGAVAALLIAVAAIEARPAFEGLGTLADRLEYSAELRAQLPTGIERLGGRDAVLGCGRVATGQFQVQMLAWELGVHGDAVEVEPARPGVVFVASAEPGSEPEPRVPAGAFRGAGRAGPWRVLGDCG